jgi:hypothetical protein
VSLSLSLCLSVTFPPLSHRSKSSPIFGEKTFLTTASHTGSLSPIREQKQQDLRRVSTEATAHPSGKALSRRESGSSTARSQNHFPYSSRKNSFERQDSASSVGSCNSISRDHSGMISRCDSLNSNNGGNMIDLESVPHEERKFVKCVLMFSLSLCLPLSLSLSLSLCLSLASLGIPDLI